MGVILWLQRLAHSPDDSTVDRTRKNIVAPMYNVLGVFFAVLGTSRLSESLGHDNSTDRIGSALSAAGCYIAAFSMFPAGLYTITTRRITRSLLEIPAAACAVGILFGDAGALLHGKCNVTGLIVLVLDALLAGDSRDKISVGIVSLTGVWLLARAVLASENVQSDPCFEPFTRFTPEHFFRVLAYYVDILVILVDFYITRSFARAVREQAAMVTASIRVTELAAVNLLKYETELTAELLLGPEGEKLPGGLRQALLQLVANLAKYRPYLPQSCLSRDDGGEAGDQSTSNGTAEPETSPDRVGCEEASFRESFSSAGSLHGSLHARGSDGCLRSTDVARRPSKRRASSLSDVKFKRVALVAVNSKSFLETLHLPGAGNALRAMLRQEVETFVRTVADEAGVVDLISGDHMFANFNAVRICTSSKLSAARTAWRMVEPAEAGSRSLAHSGTTRSGGFGASAGRTACCCSGPVVCSDFGTSRLRRFMVLGGTVNTLQCLERVAAQLGGVLVDGAVGADVDVQSNFFTMLMERLRYAKTGARPFLLWSLVGKRKQNETGEWMYELAQQAPNPHENWNRRLEEWLHFGRPFAPAELDERVPFAASGGNLAKVREQSVLVEAMVVGDTVAFQPGGSDVAVNAL